jgi:hypothetical protein
MAGKIIADTLEHSTAGSVTTDYVVNGSAKAYFNVNMSSTATFNKSLNFSSVSDEGTGEFRVTFTNAMNDSDWIAACAGPDAEYNLNFRAQGHASLGSTTTTGQFETRDMENVARDADGNSGAVFGDLA